MITGDRSYTRPQHSRLIVYLIILVVLVIGYINAFVQDDAFISFRYANNLADGNGLVWNLGEPVEGYTNFLWTVLMSVPFILNIDVIRFSLLSGLLITLGTLLSTYKLSSLTIQSGSAYLVPLILLLLGTNYTFSAYATGGLETQLQTFLFVSSAYLTLAIAKNKIWKLSAFLALSGLCILAILTRLDSIILFAILIPFLLWQLVAEPALVKREKLLLAITLLLPTVLVIGAWLFWKYSFYGDLLPNTFYAKVGSSTSLLRGLHYGYAFFKSYFLIVFIVLAPFFIREVIASLEMRLLLLICLLWGVYIVGVGGDFMEFRLFVPILPFIFILLVKLIDVSVHGRLKYALIVLVLVGSISHALTYTGGHGIESIQSLNARLFSEQQNWIGVGQIIGDVFDQSESEVLIATTAAGAIPFYSKLTTIDMLGLNDRWIARNGQTAGTRPGHQRAATLDYLMDRGVNLVLGHPLIQSIDEPEYANYSLSDLQRFFPAEIPVEQIPNTARVVDIPLDDKWMVSVLYLLQNDDIDTAIGEYDFQVHEVSISH